MFDFDHDLSVLKHQTVLCVGDIMLDEFVYGEVARISPEAPAPVIAATRSETVVGGAGNVARNVAGLGARCLLAGVIGDDAYGHALRKALADENGIEPLLVVDAARPTTRKVRFVSEHYSTHLLRADWELAKALDDLREQALIEQALAGLSKAGALVLSDYAKGVLTPRVIRTLLDAAKKAGKPSVVDPKVSDFSVYRGATVVTPNRKELSDAVRRPLPGAAEVVEAAEELRGLAGTQAVLATLGEEGMTLVREGAEPLHIPAHPVRMRDVSGAGDTVVAVLATMLAAKADIEPAIRAANAAAAVAVSKLGTATVSVDELRHAILPAATLAAEDKIVVDAARLDDRLAEWRKDGSRIGFTNGCFDLLHPGHVKLLREARAACDRLVVGLNSDASVVRLKGEGRPLQPQDARADVLAALEAVDLVVIFDEDTPLKLIERVVPNVLVKGSDYTRETVVGHEFVEAHGGRVVLVELARGHSTTDIVQRSKTAAKR
jgi:D-beta-D-heptose 7-phosphate kinase/D-beta-D-heptose 1-phosphate adenosyltransferase